MGRKFSPIECRVERSTVKRTGHGIANPDCSLDDLSNTLEVLNLNQADVSQLLNQCRETYVSIKHNLHSPEELKTKQEDYR